MAMNDADWGHGPRSPGSPAAEPDVPTAEGRDYDPARWVVHGPQPLSCSHCTKAERTMDPPHRTMDCPFPECWICSNNQDPFHWAAECPMALCTFCQQQHHEYFCTEKAPCVRCGSGNHVASLCPSDKCSLCFQNGHREEHCEMPKCPYCLSRAHQSVDCLHSPVARCSVCEGLHAPGQCPAWECYKCGQTGHPSWECQHPVVCARCGRTGHFAADCLGQESWTCHGCGRADHLMRDCPYRGELEDFPSAAPSSSSGPAPEAPVAPAPAPSSSSSSTMFAALSSVFLGRRPAEDDETTDSVSGRRVRTRFGVPETRDL